MNQNLIARLEKLEATIAAETEMLIVAVIPPKEGARLAMPEGGAMTRIEHTAAAIGLMACAPGCPA